MKFLILFSIFLFSNAQANENLNVAIKNYQNQNFEAALSELETQLQNSPQDSVLLYNLGLTLYRMGKPGLAIAKWRKALFINPHFIDAQRAIDYAHSQLKEKPLTYTPSSTWGWMHQKATTYLSIYTVFPVFLITLILVIAKLTRFYSSYKKARNEDSVLPQLSIQSHILILFSILLGSITFMLYSISSQKQATIVTSSGAIARISPIEDSAEIFKLTEGTEVILRDRSENWYKIEDPLGRAGWINSNDAEITTDSI